MSNDTRRVHIDVAREEIRGPAGVVAAPEAIGRIDRPYAAARRPSSPASELTACMRSVLGASDTADSALLVTHPTAWGTLRRSMIADAARPLAADIGLTPRAVAIARSHLGRAAARCVVIEAAVDRVDLHILCYRGEVWEVLSSAAEQWNSSSAEHALERQHLESALDTEVRDDIEVVLVDGSDAQLVAEIVAIVQRATVVGRVIPVDRDLIVRFAADRAERPRASLPQPSPGLGRSGRRLMPALGAATALLVAVTVGLIVLTRQHDERSDVSGRRDQTSGQSRSEPDRPAEPGLIEPAEFGRVRLDVPAGWMRTTQPGADAALPRVTFADPVGGGRISVMQFAVRDGATHESVASSLRARIEQRGSEDVTDFRDHETVGGRDTISYRELPGSGQPVAWYVLVGDRLQVSVGCQDGTASEIAEACERTVGSVAIAAR